VSVNDGAKEVDNGEDFDGVQFAYFQYNFTVTRNALRKVEPKPLHIYRHAKALSSC